MVLIMVERKQHRIVRDLTPGELSLLRAARADAENKMDRILGRLVLQRQHGWRLEGLSMFSLQSSRQSVSDRHCHWRTLKCELGFDGLF